MSEFKRNDVNNLSWHDGCYIETFLFDGRPITAEKDEFLLFIHEVHSGDFAATDNYFIIHYTDDGREKARYNAVGSKIDCIVWVL